MFQLQRNSYRQKASPPPKKKEEPFIRPQVTLYISTYVELILNVIEIVTPGLKIESILKLNITNVLSLGSR